MLRLCSHAQTLQNVLFVEEKKNNLQQWNNLKSLKTHFQVLRVLFFLFFSFLISWLKRFPSPSIQARRVNTRLLMRSKHTQKNPPKWLMLKRGLAVHLKWQPSSRRIPVIMQMMRDAWPLCHALLRKKKKEYSPEWRLLRTQAVGELTLAERRERERERDSEARNGEYKWQTLLPCSKRRNNSFYAAARRVDTHRVVRGRPGLRDVGYKRRFNAKNCPQVKKGEKNGSVHSPFFSQGQAEGQVNASQRLHLFRANARTLQRNF